MIFMVSRGEEKYVIYPIYFDRNVPRCRGRKVSKKYAIEKPNIEEIFKVAKLLGLNPVMEKNRAHPSMPWKKEGRILVDKKDKKTRILKQIASHL